MTKTVGVVITERGRHGIETEVEGRYGVALGFVNGIGKRGDSHSVLGILEKEGL